VFAAVGAQKRTVALGATTGFVAPKVVAPAKAALLLSKKFAYLEAVIPAKAGIHLRFLHQSKWIPAFAGMTSMRGTLQQ
jgi:hypothetical protein